MEAFELHSSQVNCLPEEQYLDKTKKLHL